MVQVRTVGIDLAKNVFQLHGVDRNGRTVLRKRLTREKLSAFMANLPLESNVQFVTIMATKMPFIGRG